MAETGGDTEFEGNIAGQVEKGVKKDWKALLTDDAQRGLKDRERKVMGRLLGLGGKEPKTVQQVADSFGVVPDRIKKIEQMAKRKVSDYYKNLGK